MKTTAIITLIVLLLFGANQLKAQYSPLKIGEKVPDFEFKIQNYHTPTVKFSDFRGKLIFLDFWSTTCASCINGLPRIQKLQNQYGDKIQVILVNIRETEEEMENRLKRRKKEVPQLNEMPSIINNKAFAQLFPHPFAGNYVWIDANGILRLSSDLNYNIYEEKINDVLAGKPITFLESGIRYGKEEPSLSEMAHNDYAGAKLPIIGSMVTPVKLEYFPAGGYQIGRVDTPSQTIRNTYINLSVIDLYLMVLEEGVKKEWESKITGPNLGNPNLDYFNMMVSDSTNYDYRFIPIAKQTDINMLSSLYCYEQILPQHTTPSEARQYMRIDLDRFLSLKYRARVDIEEVMLPCYSITRGSVRQLPEKEIKEKLKYLGKREYVDLRSLEDVLQGYFRELKLDIPYVFDDDNLTRRLRIIMPKWEKGDKLQDFEKALLLNGIAFNKTDKKINMIVVRDNL